MTTHLVIPDAQVKPGAPTQHLQWIGQYIADKQPDVIINIGDFNDLPSLSSYDRGKRDFEGRRYRKDIDAGRRALDILHTPLWKVRGRYNPRMVLTLGNHEHRIVRMTEDNPELEGALSVDDLSYTEYGWEVHKFLEVVSIDGWLILTSSRDPALVRWSRQGTEHHQLKLSWCVRDVLVQQDMRKELILPVSLSKDDSNGGLLLDRVTSTMRSISDLKATLIGEESSSSKELTEVHIVRSW